MRSRYPLAAGPMASASHAYINRFAGDPVFLGTPPIDDPDLLPHSLGKPVVDWS
jgi:hypothetical protein